MKRTKTIISVIIILCAFICLLPIPQKIDRDYYSVDIFSNKKAIVSVDITYLNFLFLKDKMRGEIQVFDDGEIYTYQTDKLFYQGRWPSNNKDGFLHHFSGFYYNPTTYWGKSGGIEGSHTIGYEITHAHISPDFNKIVMYHREDDELKGGQTRKDVGLQEAKTRQYVGNTEKGREQETIKYFEGFIMEKNKTKR